MHTHTILYPDMVLPVAPMSVRTRQLVDEIAEQINTITLNMPTVDVTSISIEFERVQINCGWGGWVFWDPPT